jgi:hypothetical protein
MLKNSPIPLWVNIFMLVLIAFMGIQVYWFYLDHASLAEAGISIEATPDLNVLYTTASRLLTMIAATVFVVVTQNPKQYLVVLFMNVLREGQEMFIDPFFPYANSPASPTMDFGIHAAIVALEIAAFIAVWKASKRQA